MQARPLEALRPTAQAGALPVPASPRGPPPQGLAPHQGLSGEVTSGLACKPHPGPQLPPQSPSLLPEVILPHLLGFYQDTFLIIQLRVQSRKIGNLGCSAERNAALAS